MTLTPFLRQDEHVLWRGKPKMSLLIASSTALGLITLLIGAYSRVIFPGESDFAFVMLAGVSVFLTMPSWQYFLTLGVHYYVTDQRVMWTRSGRASWEIAFDNIEEINRYRRIRFGAWTISIQPADGSNIDGLIDGKINYWGRSFEYLWQREAEEAERVIKERLLPIREPRVYRCMGCSFEASAQEELIHHIDTKHRGSAT